MEVPLPFNPQFFHYSHKKTGNSFCIPEDQRAGISFNDVYSPPRHQLLCAKSLCNKAFERACATHTTKIEQHFVRVRKKTESQLKLPRHILTFSLIQKSFAVCTKPTNNIIYRPLQQVACCVSATCEHSRALW